MNIDPLAVQSTNVDDREVVDPNADSNAKANVARPTPPPPAPPALQRSGTFGRCLSMLVDFSKVTGDAGQENSSQAAQYCGAKKRQVWSAPPKRK